MTIEGKIGNSMGVSQTVSCPDGGKYVVSSSGVKLSVQDFNPTPLSVPETVPGTIGGHVEIETHGGRVNFSGDAVQGVYRRFGGKTVAKIDIKRGGEVEIFGSDRRKPWVATLTHKEN